MKVSEAIRARRAVKAFDPSHRMSEEDINELVDAVRWSPSALNIQHTRLAIVTDPALRAKIREVGWNQPQMTESSILVAVCADLKAWEKEPRRYMRELPEEVIAQYLPVIENLFGANQTLQRDEGFRSGAMAAQTIMLKAQDMGYDTCPMTGYDPAAVGALIGLPEDHALIMLVAVGKRTEEPRPHWGRLPLEEIVVRDRFNRAKARFLPHP